MKKEKKYIGLLLVICMVLTAFTNVVNAAEKVEVQVKINPKIDIMVTQKDSDLDMTNFDADVIQRLQGYGLDTSNVKIQTVKRSSISTNNADASVIFNNWGRIGYPGQWSVVNVGGTSTIQNAENTANYTGFYYPDSYEYTDMEIEFDNRSTDADDDFMGCMFRFNLTKDSADSRSKEATAYIFALDKHDNGGGITNGSYNGLLKITKKPFAHANVEVLKNIPNVTWTRNTWAHYKIVVKGNNIKIYQNNNLIIDYTDTSATAIKSGSYGLFSYSQAYAQYKNFSVVTTNTKAFKDVLLEPSWREDAKHIVVNVDTEIDDTLTGTDTIGEILSRTMNDDIHLIQWGTDKNKALMEDFISRNDNKGFYTPGNDYAAAVDKTAQYIKNLFENSGNSQYVIVGEDSDLVVNPSELKTGATSIDFPNGRWMVHHNYTYYANNLGQSTSTEVYTPDLMCNFDKPGEYNIYFDDDLVKTVYAHRRPVADFNVNISGGTINIESNSIDLDTETDIGYGKGISAERWYYKKATDSDWTEGKITSFDKNQTYIIKLEVTDFQDCTSYTTKYIGTGNPVASFNYTANRISKYQNLNVIDSSYDPAGYNITGWEWTLKKGSVIVGTYTTQTPSVVNFNTAALGTGNYTYTLVVKNSQGVKSEAYTKAFTVIEDTDKPEVIIDPTHCEWKTSQDINLLFSDGDSGFAKWRYAIDSTQTVSSETAWSAYNTSESYTLTNNVEGQNYLHIQALDNAGNLLERTVGVYKIDNSDPVGTYTVSMPTDTDRFARINFEASDAVSGVKKVTLPDGNTTLNTTIDYHITKSGTYTFVVEDYAGNTSTVSIPVVVPSEGVVVKYVDVGDGNKEIADRYIVNGDAGDPYAAPAKDIPGYKMVKIPTPTVGELQVDRIELIYEYRKISNLTVRHIDLNKPEGSNDIIDPIVKVYEQGQEYETSQRDLENYVLIQRPTNPIGTFEREDIEVVYGYKKVSAGVDIKYVDDITGEVLEEINLTGNEKDPYSSEVHEFEGYELEVSPTNPNGEMTVEKIIVEYRYRKLFDLTVKYIDLNQEDNNEIDDTITRKIRQGYPYETEKKSFPGYALVEEPTNASSLSMPGENVEVVYGYKKISAGVDIKYIDDITGEDLFGETIHLKGNEKDPYSSVRKDFEGYELEVYPSNPSGEMKVELTTVEYRYRKASTVTVKHIDLNSGDENNIIAATTTQNIKEGYDYQTNSVYVPGYILVVTPGNANGTMGRENIDVIYGYKKIAGGVDIKYVDKATGKMLQPVIHLDGKEKDPYTSTDLEFTGYAIETIPANANGEMAVDTIEVVYEYLKLSKLTIRHIDLNKPQGNDDIVDPSETYIKEGYPYTSSALEDTSYVLVDSPEEPNGTMGREDIELTYTYKKSSAGVDVIYVDDITGKVLDSIHLEGNENDSYTTTAKDIEEYELEVTPDNTSGKMTVEKITVEYRYRKTSQITIECIDENTGDVIHTVDVGTYKEGYEYETLPPSIEGYAVVTYPENQNGTMGKEDITITYGYKKVSSGIVANYVDIKDNAILEQEIFTGNENDEISMVIKDIYNYVYVNNDAPESLTATLTVEPQTYNFYYRKRVTMRIICKDKETGEIFSDISRSGIEGDEYNVVANGIPGYVVVGEDTVNGIYDRDTKEIVFEYVRTSEGVLVNHIDIDTEEIIKTENITGSKGDSYTTSKIDDNKYTFVKVKGETTGELKEEQIVVNYYYEKKTSTVTVRYVSEDGNVIKTYDMSAKVDETYKVELEEFKNYTLKETSDNLEGVYTVEPITVTIVMAKIPAKITIVIKGPDGEELLSIEEDGFVGDIFTEDLPEIEGFELPNGGKIEQEIVDDETVITVVYDKKPEDKPDDNDKPVTPGQTDPEVKDPLEESPNTAGSNVAVLLILAGTSVYILLKKFKFSK